MRIPAILFCVILSVVSTVFAETKLENIPGAEAEVYKKASGDDLRIYRIAPAGHDPKIDKRPAAIFFFGGGWNG